MKRVKNMDGNKFVTAIFLLIVYLIINYTIMGKLVASEAKTENVIAIIFLIPFTILIQYVLVNIILIRAGIVKGYEKGRIDKEEKL